MVKNLDIPVCASSGGSKRGTNILRQGSNANKILSLVESSCGSVNGKLEQGEKIGIGTYGLG